MKKEELRPIYKDLYLVTWYNLITRTIEQILTDNLNDANKIAYEPKRLKDIIMRRLFKKVKFTVCTITADGVYTKGGKKLQKADECEGFSGGNRYLLNIYDSSGNDKASSVLINKEEIREAILWFNRKKCKSIVINEIDYWGVYTINQYGERDSKLNIGSPSSAYEDPGFIKAPSYKVSNPLVHYKTY